MDQRERRADHGEQQEAAQRRIAELEAANRELREIKARFEAVYNHHYQLTGLLDYEGRLLMANRTALRFAGAAEHEVIGKPFWETPWWTHSSEEQEKLKAAIARTQRGESVRFESTHTSAAGQAREIDFFISPAFDDEGRVVYLVPEGYDITARKRAEEERRKLGEQLRQSQKMEAVGQLAGGVAHDFNNLLQAILGFGEMARTEATPGSALHHELDQVLKAAHRATTLVRQLLAFSRRQVLKLEVLDLSEVVEELGKMVRRVVGEHIAFGILSKPGPHTVHADRGQLEQIIMNLCLNARDAMPEGGRLAIETATTEVDASLLPQHAWAEPGQYVTLTVSDTGVGMDAEQRRRIFEPFYTTKEEGHGTGLGLSTVYGIVRQHNGMIHVESQPGRGSTFSIYLPRSDAPKDSPRDEQLPPPPGGSETLLVAEDDESVLTWTTQVLESAGYTVLAASDGEEAIRAFDRHAPEIGLALLDVVMPELSGRAVFNHIRDAGHETPVLFASGYSSGGVHTNFVLEEGMQFIRKPYRHDELLRKVRSVLDA